MSFNSWSDATLPSTFCREHKHWLATTIYLQKQDKHWQSCLGLLQTQWSPTYSEFLEQVWQLLEVPEEGRQIKVNLIIFSTKKAALMSLKSVVYLREGLGEHHEVLMQTNSLFICRAIIWWKAVQCGWQKNIIIGNICENRSKLLKTLNLIISCLIILWRFYLLAKQICNHQVFNAIPLYSLNELLKRGNFIVLLNW